MERGKIRRSLNIFTKKNNNYLTGYKNRLEHKSLYEKKSKSVSYDAFVKKELSLEFEKKRNRSKELCVIL